MEQVPGNRCRLHIINNMHEGASYYRQVVLKIPGIAGPGNVGTSFQFDDQPDLRYARIQAMEAYTASALSVAYPEPSVVLPDAQAKLVTFVFETNDPDDVKHQKGADGRFQSTLQTVKWLPFTAINRLQNQATNTASFVRQLVPFKDLYITWQKSFINIAPGGLANTVDTAIVLGVWYTFLNKQGKEIVRT